MYFFIFLLLFFIVLFDGKHLFTIIQQFWLQLLVGIVGKINFHRIWKNISDFRADTHLQKITWLLHSVFNPCLWQLSGRGTKSTVISESGRQNVKWKSSSINLDKYYIMEVRANSYFHDYIAWIYLWSCCWFAIGEFLWFLVLTANLADTALSPQLRICILCYLFLLHGVLEGIAVSKPFAPTWISFEILL